MFVSYAKVLTAGNLMKEQNAMESKSKQIRNYKVAIISITIILISAILILLSLPGVENFDAFDVTILPMLNAIFNIFAFIFIIGAFIAIRKGNVKVHKRFIYAALVATSLFLINYVIFHFIASSTSFGGTGFIAIVYYFILITHITLAMATIPLVLTSITRAWNQENKLHKKIARWTMPIWLYVSFTGVVVYLLIRPYY